MLKVVVLEIGVAQINIFFFKKKGSGSQGIILSVGGGGGPRPFFGNSFKKFEFSRREVCNPPPPPAGLPVPLDPRIS